MSFFLISNSFPVFVLGNLLMGLGVGFYWPSTEAVVADITPEADRNESYAVVRLADSIGLGLGVILGGVLISTTQRYRLLFAVDGISFLVFFGLIYWAIAETRPAQEGDRTFWQGWNVALGDSLLLIYATVNILFTSYIAQIQSTLPVYFNKFVPTATGAPGLPEATISVLFTGHVILTAVVQLPMARWLRPLAQPRALMVSACLWGVGFTLVWAIGANLFSRASGGGRSRPGRPRLGHHRLHADRGSFCRHAGTRSAPGRLFICELDVLGDGLLHRATRRRLGARSGRVHCQWLLAGGSGHRDPAAGGFVLSRSPIGCSAKTLSVTCKP